MTVITDVLYHVFNFRLLRYHDFHGAIVRLSTLIEKLPWDVRLRELRADAYKHVSLL